MIGLTALKDQNAMETDDIRGVMVVGERGKGKGKGRGQRL
jgi:hypothetical protein